MRPGYEDSGPVIAVEQRVVQSDSGTVFPQG